MDQLVTALKAAAEPTRLRILALCRRGELTVSELVTILGQSQPRVSRHLKVLGESGLLSKSREGTFAFFRLSDSGRLAELARTLADTVPTNDPVFSLDMKRLDRILSARAERAAVFFRDNAWRWNDLRKLYGGDEASEAAVLDLIPAQFGGDLLDIGTGTGRILELVGPRFSRAIGVDLSREMLAVARASIGRPELSHCQVRQGDMLQLPVPNESTDLAIIHQVLHYATDPAAAIAEAARALRPGGRLLIVDFAPHELETLRTEHAHSRLGFHDEELTTAMRDAGLTPGASVQVPGDPLTIVIWYGDKPGTEMVPEFSSPDRVGVRTESPETQPPSHPVTQH